MRQTDIWTNNAECLKTLKLFKADPRTEAIANWGLSGGAGHATPLIIAWGHRSVMMDRI